MAGRHDGRVDAVRSVVVDRPADAVLDVVRDIELLEPLERKARSVEVHPEGPDRGWYRIHGRLARVVPWTGDFSYTHHDQGWHSADLAPRSDGWGVSGGFVVIPIDDRTCRITHYEDYLLPAHLRWLRPLMAWYMRRSQVGEMRDLARLVEDRVS